MMAKPYKVTFAATRRRSAAFGKRRGRRLLMVAAVDAEWPMGRDGVTWSKKGQMVRVMKRLHRESERENEKL